MPGPTVTDIRYVETQMEKVAPFPIMEGTNGQFRIKLQSEKGETNWLNISNAQFNIIESTLLGVVSF